MKAKLLTMALAAMSLFTAGSVQAGVVLSNMGTNGLTDTSGPTNTDILSTNLISAGFTTGATAQQLDWISIVGFNNDSGTKLVSLFSDNAGSPGTLLSSSTATAVGAKGVYQFNFSGTNLAANTKYWVLPEVGLSWYTQSANLAPTAQNSSGFAYDGVMTSANSGSTWDPSGFNYTLGISTSDVPTVPEPALTSLLCLGGIAFMRRRMSK